MKRRGTGLELSFTQKKARLVSWGGLLSVMRHVTRYAALSRR
jgi:hypothetical protein